MTDVPARHRAVAAQAAALAELAAAGYVVTPEGADRARRRRRAVEAAWTPQRRLEARRRAVAAVRSELPAGDAARSSAA